jgi:hypothetical protein
MVNQNLFPTPVFKGQFVVSNAIITDYKKWVEIEKLLDPDGSKYSTTMNGWQRPFGPADKKPTWMNSIIESISDIMKNLNCNQIKSSWVVEYDVGGYQDLHMHTNNGSNWTVIFNITGSGSVLLHDPRPHFVSHTSIYLEEIVLGSGEFLVMPSWLVHSSRPCSEARSIYVADIR